MAIMMRKQRGAAGIYMALLLVPLFGAVFLALEGTRYIQKQNRLADGAEAAALAVTMANHGNTSSYEKDLAEKYIQAYVRDIKDISQLDVTTKEGQTTIPSSEGDIEKNYTQYKVTAKTSHNSWFSSTLIPSFSPVETVANQAVARNYPEIPGDKYMDIVFVSDFSGSMTYKWNYSRTKIDVLKSAIEKISKEILIDEDGEVKNKIGFVPYNMRTQKIDNHNNSCVTQLSYKNHINGQDKSQYTSYNDIDWSYYASNVSRWNLELCYFDSRYCNRLGINKKDVNTIFNLVSYRYNRRWPGGIEIYPFHPDQLKYVDIKKTIDNTFVDKVIDKNFHPRTNYYHYNDLLSIGSCNANFHTIDMTNDISKLSSINNMSATGGTSVYQGLIQGAQLLYKDKQKYIANNKEGDYKKRIKMLLILSDGREEPYKNTFKKLVNYPNKGRGLCKKIRDEFNDGDFPLYIGVLGINFEASAQEAFKDCVGENNITDVDKVDDLIKTIKEMIKKGTQTDGISKLHYRYTD